MQIMLSTFDDMKSGQIIIQEQKTMCDVALRRAHATIDAVEKH